MVDHRQQLLQRRDGRHSMVTAVIEHPFEVQALQVDVIGNQDA
ncbi:hypothetical protein [Pseudomonas sp. AM4(2022)]|nr:hypothetical protein [Pseudomonas sp. AM4(2022)]